jgi:hypothetical protein
MNNSRRLGNNTSSNLPRTLDSYTGTTCIASIVPPSDVVCVQACVPVYSILEVV